MHMLQEMLGLKHCYLPQFHTQTLQCLCIALIKILLMGTRENRAIKYGQTCLGSKI